MKSTMIWGATVLFNLSMLNACGGVSNIGSSSGNSGSANSAVGGAKDLPEASKTGGAPGASGDLAVSNGGYGAVDFRAPSEGGESSDPITIPVGPPCQADLDCPDVACGFYCLGGGSSCENYCVNGHCVTKPGGICPVECSANEECAIPCVKCGNDYEACAEPTCLMGVCQTPKPVCDTQSCDELACGAPCMLCDPSTASCQSGSSFCDNDGKCAAGTPHCDCMTAMDCGTAPPNCYPCSDGSCAAFDCRSNKCTFTCPQGVSLQCSSSTDCLVLDSECQLCPNGKCAVQACINSSCGPVCPLN